MRESELKDGEKRGREKRRGKEEGRMRKEEGGRQKAG